MVNKSLAAAAEARARDVIDRHMAFAELAAFHKIIDFTDAYPKKFSYILSSIDEISGFRFIRIGTGGGDKVIHLIATSAKIVAAALTSGVIGF
jgi:hypothetical protein